MMYLRRYEKAPMQVRAYMRSNIYTWTKILYHDIDTDVKFVQMHVLNDHINLVKMESWKNRTYSKECSSHNYILLSINIIEFPSKHSSIARCRTTVTQQAQQAVLWEEPSPRFMFVVLLAATKVWLFVRQISCSAANMSYTCGK